MSIRYSLFLIGGMEIKSTFAAAVFCTNSVSVSAGLDSFSRQATWGKRVSGFRLADFWRGVRICIDSCFCRRTTRLLNLCSGGKSYETPRTTIEAQGA